jgi:hypothetical protein
MEKSIERATRSALKNAEASGIRTARMIVTVTVQPESSVNHCLHSFKGRPLNLSTDRKCDTVTVRRESEALFLPRHRKS